MIFSIFQIESSCKNGTHMYSSFFFFHSSCRNSIQTYYLRVCERVCMPWIFHSYFTFVAFHAQNHKTRGSAAKVIETLFSRRFFCFFNHSMFNRQLTLGICFLFFFFFICKTHQMWFFDVDRAKLLMIAFRIESNFDTSN